MTPRATMTGSFVFLFSVLCTAIVLSPQNRPGTMGSLPLGWWKLDQVEGNAAVDYGRGGHEGQLRGDPWWSSAGAGVGGLYLDGEDDYILVGEFPEYAVTESMTLTGWVQLSAESSSASSSLAIIAKEESFALGLSSRTRHPELALRIPGAKGEKAGYVRCVLDEELDSSWHHLAATYDSREDPKLIRLYRDGELVKQCEVRVKKNYSGKIAAADGRLELGRWKEKHEDYLSGSIRDVRFYDRALSAEEIAGIVLTPDNDEPQKPLGLRARAVSETEIELTWGYPETEPNPDQFILERRSSASQVQFVVIAEISGDQCSYADSSLSPGTAQVYRVRALNGGGFSSYSEEAGEITFLEPFTAPAERALSWWKFDEGAGGSLEDFGRGEHHGTVRGSAQWSPGYLGGALVLDGVDDYVGGLGNYEEHAILTSGSLSTWVRLGDSERSNDKRTPAIVGKSRSFALRLRSGSREPEAVIYIPGKKGGYVSCPAGVELEPQVWYHLAGTVEETWNGGLAGKLYLDGAEVCSQTLAVSSLYGDGREVEIGHWRDDNSFLDGAVDDTRIYEWTLSAEKIFQLSLLGDPAFDDAYEPNDTMDEAGGLAFETETYSDLNVSLADPDFYRVEIPEGGGLTVRMDFSEAEADVHLAAFRDIEESKAASTPVAASISAEDFEELTIEEAGVHFIRVELDPYSSGDRAHYVLSLTALEPPEVFFTTGATSGTESISAVDLELALSEASPDTVTVDYQLTAGTTAEEGVDFTLVASSVSFAPGEITAEIPLAVVDDFVDEADETIAIELTGGTNVALGDPLAHTYTIIDDDQAGVAVTGSVQVTEGGATGTYTMTLQSQPTADVVVTIVPDSQTTVSVSDVTFTSLDWNAPRTVTVTAVDDESVEGPHSSTITHQSASVDPLYDALPIDLLSVAVIDNDASGGPPARIEETEGTTLVAEDGLTDTYTLVLDAAPTDTVTVTLVHDGQLEVAPSLITFTPQSLMQTVTVTATNDLLTEDSTHSATVNHAFSSSDVRFAGLEIPLTVKITDNDAVQVVVSSISPTAGTFKGGTPVWILGTSFTQAAIEHVLFGDEEAEFLVLSETEILAWSPPGSGNQNVSVANPSGRTVDGHTFSYRPQPETVVFENRQDIVGQSMPEDASDITARDLNHDGLLDLVAATPQGALVLRNTSLGSLVQFEALPLLSTSGSVLAVTTGDYNQDGRVDLAASGSEGVWLFENTSSDPSTLTFVSAQNLQQGTGDRPAISSGDLDGDGRPDLVVADPTSRGITFFLNQTTLGGPASFDILPVFTDHEYHAITMGEFVSEAETLWPHRAEFALAGLAPGSGFVTAFYDTGAGPGNFSPIFVGSDIPGDPWGVAMGDFDQDGVVDLVSSNLDTGELVFHQNQSDGVFSPKPVCPVGDLEQVPQTRGLRLGDLDGDGYPDLALAHTDNARVRLLLYQPGSSSPGVMCVRGEDPIDLSLSFDQHPWAVAPGDFNNDGQTDVAVASLGPGANAVSIFARQSDRSVILVETGGSTEIEEGGQFDGYSVVLARLPDDDVLVMVEPDTQVFLTSGNQAGGAGEPIQLTFSADVGAPNAWDVPQFVLVKAEDDSEEEGEHSSTIAHTVSSNDTAFNNIPVEGVTARIVDNDTLGFKAVTIFPRTLNVVEGVAGGVGYLFSISINRPPEKVPGMPVGTVSVFIEPPADVAISGHEFGETVEVTLHGGNLKYFIEPVMTTFVSVKVKDDTVLEGFRIATVSHRVESYDEEYDGYEEKEDLDVTLNIEDDDLGFTIQETGGYTAVNREERDDSYSITAVSDIAPGKSVRVTVTPPLSLQVGRSGEPLQPPGGALFLFFDQGNLTDDVIVHYPGLSDEVDLVQIGHTVLFDDAVDELLLGPVRVYINNSITVSKRVLAVGEGGPDDEFTVRLNTPPASLDQVWVVVQPALDDQLDLGNGVNLPVVLQFTNSNWNVPQTITVVAADNSLAEAPVSSSIEVFVPSGLSGENHFFKDVALDLLVVVQDNDGAGIQVFAPDPPRAEEGGANGSFGLHLTTQPQEEVTVDLGNADGQLNLPISSLSFNSENWIQIQWVEVEAADDSEVEGPHAGLVGLQATSSDAQYNISAPSVEVEIVDNDFANPCTAFSDPLLCVQNPIANPVISSNGLRTLYDPTANSMGDRSLERPANGIQDVTPALSDRSLYEDSLDLVSLHNGNVLYSEMPLRVKGRGVDFSFIVTHSAKKGPIDGPLGLGWDHNYNARLVKNPDDQAWILSNGFQQDLVFWLEEDRGDHSYFKGPPGSYSSLREDPDRVTIRNRHGMKTTFLRYGNGLLEAFLEEIRDPNGNRLRFSYDELGRLSLVEDALDRPYTFEYQGENRIYKLTDYSGREVEFEYAGGELTKIKYPEVTGVSTGNNFSGTHRKYRHFVYWGGDLEGRLLAIRNPNENSSSNEPWVGFVYQVFGPYFGWIDTINFGTDNYYGSNLPSSIEYQYEGNTLTVKDRNGNSTIYTFNPEGHVSSIEEPVEGGRAKTQLTYTSEGEVFSVVHPLTNATVYEYEAGLLPRHRWGNVRRVIHLPDPDRGGDQPEIEYAYEYDPVFGTLTARTNPRGAMSLFIPDYQENPSPENLLQEELLGQFDASTLRSILNPSGVAQDLNGDGDVAQSRGNLVALLNPLVGLEAGGPQALREGRTAQFSGVALTYNTFGLLTRRVDEEENVQRFSYYTATSPGSGASSPDYGGYLATTVIDSPDLGPPRANDVFRDIGRNSGLAPEPTAITTNYLYDSRGNVVQEVNPRGVVTEYEVNQLDQVVLEKRAAGLQTSGRAAGYQNRDESQLSWDKGPYQKEYYYDYNDNLIATFVEDKDGNSAADDQVLGPSPGYPGGIQISGKVGWDETYYYHDILNNERKVRRELSGDGTNGAAETLRSYDPNENPTALIAPEGNRQVWTYTPRDLPGTHTRGADTPEASTVSFDYDLNGNRFGLVDAADNDDTPGGEVMGSFFDGFDRITELHTRFDTRVVLTYDAASNVIQKTVFGDDGTGQEVMLQDVEYGYDARDRLVETRELVLNPTGLERPVPPEPSEIITRYAYDRLSRQTFAIEHDGDIRELRYDGGGRAVQSVDLFDESSEVPSMANDTQYFYDDNGNEVLRIEADRASLNGSSYPAPSPISYTFYSQYDALDRRILEVDSANQATYFAYDSRDNMVMTADARGPEGVSYTLTTGETLTINGRGNVTKLYFDAASRSTKTEIILTANGLGDGTWSPSPDPSQAEDGLIHTLPVYDRNSRLVEQVDDRGNRTRYAYDAVDRRSHTTYADDTAETFLYDADSNVRTRTDANGTVFTYVYDGGNRLRRVTALWAAGNPHNLTGTTEMTWDWDGRSRLSRAVDGGNTVERKYNSRDQLLEERLTTDYQPPRVVSYEYRDESDRSAVTYPSEERVEYSFDDRDRITSIVYGGEEVAAYDYFGSRVLERRHGNGARLAFHDDKGGLTGYDQARRRQEILHLGPSNQTLASFFHQFDGANNPTSVAVENFTQYEESWLLDSVSRLTTREVSASPTSFNEIFQMDGANNWTQFASTGAGDYGFDFTPNSMNAYEQALDRSRAHDAKGNLTSDGVLQYRYDAFNRLREVLQPEPCDCELRLQFLKGFNNNFGVGQVETAIAYLEDNPTAPVTFTLSGDLDDLAITPETFTFYPGDVGIENGTTLTVTGLSASDFPPFGLCPLTNISAEGASADGRYNKTVSLLTARVWEDYPGPDIQFQGIPTTLSVGQSAIFELWLEEPYGDRRVWFDYDFRLRLEGVEDGTSPYVDFATGEAGFEDRKQVRITVLDRLFPDEPMEAVGVGLSMQTLESSYRFCPVWDANHFEFSLIGTTSVNARAGDPAKVSQPVPAAGTFSGDTVPPPSIPETPVHSSLPVGSFVASYGYDALGRRVERRVPAPSGGGGAVAALSSLEQASTQTLATFYYYDGQEVIAEYEIPEDGGSPSAATRSSSGPEALLKRRYVLGASIDEPILMIDSLDNRYYYHQDYLGSVAALTDDEGAVAERYFYAPNGNFVTTGPAASPILEKRGNLGNLYRFTGRRHDPETGLYYFRARMYDSWTGRFLQRDPAGIWGDPSNLGNGYTYAGNKFTSSVDPTGLVNFAIHGVLGSGTREAQREVYQTIGEHYFGQDLEVTGSRITALQAMVSFDKIAPWEPSRDAREVGREVARRMLESGDETHRILAFSQGVNIGTSALEQFAEALPEGDSVNVNIVFLAPKIKGDIIEEAIQKAREKNIHVRVLILHTSKDKIVPRVSWPYLPAHFTGGRERPWVQIDLAGTSYDDYMKHLWHRVEPHSGFDAETLRPDPKRAAQRELIRQFLFNP